MPALTDTALFNQAGSIVEGWYWAARSRALRPGRTLALNLLGKDLVLFRGKDGKAVALDAHCPHMGAHLAEGRVEGNQIRCFFHGWKFDRNGECVHIPTEQRLPCVERLPVWEIEERYGLIWVWIGAGAGAKFPEVPELDGVEIVTALGKAFRKPCHPHVVMVNAIDEQHFATVHHLPLDLDLEPHEVSTQCITFTNAKPIPGRTVFAKLLRRYYNRGKGCYALSYWSGCTGTVTLGPDFLHFHIMFALRPTAEGTTEGQTILLTRRRKGIGGALFSRVLLLLSQLASFYFADGDTKIFRSIRFLLKTPTKADRSVIRFIQHLERQPRASWGWAATAQPADTGITKRGAVGDV